jgi:hypothetical protein
VRSRCRFNKDEVVVAEGATSAFHVVISGSVQLSAKNQEQKLVPLQVGHFWVISLPSPLVCLPR